MLWGAASGALELRHDDSGGVRISGRFPYTETELAPGRSERIEARAFAARVEAGENIHFFAGHDYERPLASVEAGTLQVRDTDTALEIEARIDTGITWAADFVAAHRAGLVRGLSPGFRVSQGGERIERRGAGIVRSITRADLYELSAVTRPAYPAAQIEARAWNADEPRRAHRTLARWRP